MKEKVLAGLGVIIVDEKGQILIGKRKGFAPQYAIPGGSLEAGETFEEGAKREIKEETDLEIEDIEVIAITNNLETYKATGKQYISVILLAKSFKGEAKVMEPEKCEKFIWCNPNEIPEPVFDGTRLGVKCYLENRFYTRTY